MLTSISVNGFKTLSDFQIELKPGLNILVGPNGSGKTNIISFFEFLAHLVESDASEATSRLGGAGAVFRRVEETYEPNITARVTGSYRVDRDSPFYHIRRKAAEKLDFRTYSYEFTLLFSGDLESVVFTKQSFRYGHTKRFLPAALETDQNQIWSLQLESTLNKDLVPQVKVRKLISELVDFPFFHSSKSHTTAVTEMERFILRFNLLSLPS
jgi:energy-coupling factor transporter ATP-binding protein EcfA2